MPTSLHHHYYPYEEGDVVIEIGSGAGHYTLAIVERIGSTGVVYGIEASPHLFKCLKRNVSPYTNVYPKHIKVSPEDNSALHGIESETLDSLLVDLKDVNLLILQLDGLEAANLRTFKSWDKIHHLAIASHRTGTQAKEESEIKPILTQKGYAFTHEEQNEQNWIYAKKWHPHLIENFLSAEPIFIGGSGRSGTTLLRMILNAHPDLFCGPETSLIVDQYFYQAPNLEKLAQLLDLEHTDVEAIAQMSPYLPHFMHLLLSEVSYRKGKTRWAEKTPGNILQLQYILNNFPKARFIHMIRDGRDVISSLKTHPKYKIENGKRIPLNTQNPLSTCIRRWKKSVERGLHFRGHPRYYELYYEDLITKPEETLKALFQFLDLKWTPQVLEYHRATNAAQKDQLALKFPQNREALDQINQANQGKWKERLSNEEYNVILAEVGDLLKHLNYI